MYRYRYGTRFVGVFREVGSSEQTFFVEAHSNNSGQGSCRIEMSRREALAHRRQLNALLKATAPARKRR